MGIMMWCLIAMAGLAFGLDDSLSERDAGARLPFRSHEGDACTREMGVPGFDFLFRRLRFLPLNTASPVHAAPEQGCGFILFPPSWYSPETCVGRRSRPRKSTDVVD